MLHVQRRGLRYALLSVAALVSIAAVVAGTRIVISKMATSYSGQTHLLDFTEGFRIWWQRPLTGFGFDSDEYIWTHYMSAYRDGMGYTSGLLFLLIHGGLVLALYMIVPFVLLVLGSHDWHMWYFAGFVMIVFITAPVQNCAFLLLVAAYGYASFIWRYSRRMSSLPLVARTPLTHEGVRGMPEISVIIPVYNQEEYVGACMDSLLDQSFEDFEVLAVNDGSTDASVSILEGYEQRDGRVQLIDQNNSGVSVARNNGLSHAKGEWVCFIDPDDYVAPDYLDTLLKATERNTDIAMSTCVAFDDQRSARQHFFLNPSRPVPLMRRWNCSVN